MKMKKQTRNRFFKTGILVLGISLSLWNCNKEELKEGIVLQELDGKYHSSTVKLDDIYDVKKYLDEIIPRSGIDKTSEIEGAIFDEENVLEIIDTLQNTNYSLRFRFQDTPISEFYNLVVGRTPEGELKIPFVLKYVCNENFLEDYIASGFDIHYFKGTVKMHVYTDFFSIDAFSRTTGNCPPELDAVGDPIACEEDPIGIGSGGGGSGSSGVSSGTGSGSTSSSGVGSGNSGGTGGQNISLTCTCVGHSVTQIEDGTCTCPSYVLEIFMTRSSNRMTDDCPSCADTNPVGGIGINNPDISLMVDTIKNNLELSSDELQWLHNDAENEEIIDIHFYLTLNSLDGNYTDESIEFAEGLVRGNMIEDNIIDNNLDPCSKLILNNLKSLQQNDIAKIIARFGPPNSTYDWEIKTGVPLINPNNDAETDWKRDINNNAIDYNYLSHINPMYTNQATKIGISRTILHELIHAYLISLVDDAILTGSNDITNFPLLWNSLINSTYNNNPNQLQHEIMGRKFIDPIKYALKEWDNAQQSDQYYEDLAWGALENTSTFNSLFPNGSSSRSRIINTNLAEDTNSIHGGINPKNNPC